jgi:hypothetical protein
MGRAYWNPVEAIRLRRGRQHRVNEPTKNVVECCLAVQVRLRGTVRCHAAGSASDAQLLCSLKLVLVELCAHLWPLCIGWHACGTLLRHVDQESALHAHICITSDA